MVKRAVIVGGILLLLMSLGMGQTTVEKKPVPPALQPAGQLADEMAARLAADLHVKTTVGEPIKIGSVTLIPIVMIEVGFGGGGKMPSGDAAASKTPQPGVDAFYASGEARPLGFVAITKKGVRFIGVGKTPAK